MQANISKRIVIPCTFAYLNCWRKGENNGGKYSMTAIIDKSDQETVTRIMEKIEDVTQASTAKWGGKVPANLKTPLHDGDVEKADNSIFKNKYYINAKSSVKPEVVDSNLEAIINQTDIYSGCSGNVSITLYAYSHNGNRGIAACLGNIQKIKDGNPLVPYYSAKDDFSVQKEQEDTDQ